MSSYQYSINETDDDLEGEMVALLPRTKRISTNNPRLSVPINIRPRRGSLPKIPESTPSQTKLRRQTLIGSDLNDDAESAICVNDVNTKRALNHGVFIHKISKSDPMLVWFALITLVVYLVIGTLYFELAKKDENTDRGTSFVESLYFSMVVLSTVGYGNTVEGGTNAGHIFLALYALTGVAVVGLCFGIFMDVVDEVLASRAERRKERKEIKATSDVTMDFEHLVSNPNIVRDGLIKDLKNMALDLAILVVVLACGTILLYCDGGQGTDIDGNATIMQAFFLLRCHCHNDWLW